MQGFRVFHIRLQADVEIPWKTCGKEPEMLIKSGQEALFVAIEMERGAVQTYERALMLTSPDDPKIKPLRQQLAIMLNDEHDHLTPVSIAVPWAGCGPGRSS